ncbi:MAG: LON peptidase substrate-binding domain-containing protein, partial [Pseudomonadota bacterium]
MRFVRAAGWGAGRDKGGFMADDNNDKKEIEFSAEGGLFPVLPLRDIVVFPNMIVPLFVGREKSIAALEDAMAADKQILLVTQRNAADDEPKP